jgi:hypothetical protein
VKGNAQEVNLDDSVKLLVSKRGKKGKISEVA